MCSEILLLWQKSDLHNNFESQVCILRFQILHRVLCLARQHVQSMDLVCMPVGVWVHLSMLSRTSPSGPRGCWLKIRPPLWESLENSAQAPSVSLGCVNRERHGLRTWSMIQRGFGAPGGHVFVTMGCWAFCLGLRMALYTGLESALNAKYMWLGIYNVFRSYLYEKTLFF